MRFLPQVKYAEVLAQWIRREYNPDKHIIGNYVLERNSRFIITDEDYDNPSKNQMRLRFMDYRSNLLYNIPIDTKWFKAGVAREDLGAFRVIKDTSWNILSNNTGNIDVTVKRWLDFVEDPVQIAGMDIKREERWWLYDVVFGTQRLRNMLDDSGLNLTLILVGASEGGPFTIIEGSKTAMALYSKHFVDDPDSSYPAHFAYVGISAAMNDYPWHYSSLA